MQLRTHLTVTISSLTLILWMQPADAQLLTNPSFEEGNSLGSEMAGWTRCGDHPEWVEVFVKHAGIRPRTGNYAIGSYSGVHRTHWGGAYQKVDGLKPGYRYRASVWFFTDAYDSSRDPHRVESNCRCRLGFDPTGSEDLRGDTVVWSHPVCTKGHKWAAEYWPYSHRHWSKLEAEVVAQGESGTFFMETAQLFGYDYKLNLFDDAALEEIPVAMEVVQHYSASEPAKITLAVKLANRDPQPVNGSLELELPDGLGAAPRSFNGLSRQPQTLTFDLSAEDGHPGRYMGKVVVRLDSGQNYWRRFRFHVPLTSPKASRAMNIDGRLTDWRRQRPAVVGKATESGAVFVRDCLGQTWLHWDEKNLYLATEVEDDDFVQDHTDTKAHAQDSLDVLIDAMNDAPVDPTPVRIRHGWGPNDHEFLIALTPEGPRAFRWTDVGVSYFHGKPEPAITVAARREGLHTVYEMAIPWSALSDLQPAPGQVLGIDIALNDTDRDSDWKAIGLSNAICGNAYRRPHNCVDLILTDSDGKAESIPSSVLMTDQFPTQ